MLFRSRLLPECHGVEPCADGRGRGCAGGGCGRLEHGQGRKKVVDLLTGLCQIAAPALLALAFINLVSARVEGFAFIYFSNADVLLEVQTAANMSSATCAIVNLVLLAVSSIAGIVSAFFTLKK